MTVKYHGYIIESKTSKNGKHYYTIWEGNRYNICHSVRKVVSLIDLWEGISL